MNDSDYRDMRMPFQRGTLAWEASYHRRVGIESLYADLKSNRLDVHQRVLPRLRTTRAPTPPAASQHPLRHAPRNIPGRHGTGQIAIPPRHGIHGSR
ncbi:hypothetical protein [Rhodococcus opacus]|uniref:hypothetical protein n=1 Tax=Rhodococcus opacus TaxID=37919 RepID=UPI001C4898B9|nr:hypothetical protein [Rhodococcus opacus]MBV6760717.1 hypothetical protein [Rhodococcus opacus]